MESPVEKTRSIRVAVDAMGGDFGPCEVIKGCVEAIRGLPDVSLVLVGDEAAILRELAMNGEHLSDRLSILHTTQTIDMCEPPVQAVRSKKDSSINRGMELLRDKKVDAFLSAGSTGAMVAGNSRSATRTLLRTRSGDTFLRFPTRQICAVRTARGWSSASITRHMPHPEANTPVTRTR